MPPDAGKKRLVLEAEVSISPTVAGAELREVTHYRDELSRRTAWGVGSEWWINHTPTTRLPSPAVSRKRFEVVEVFDARLTRHSAHPHAGTRCVDLGLTWAPRRSAATGRSSTPAGVDPSATSPKYNAPSQGRRSTESVDNHLLNSFLLYVATRWKP